MMTLAWFQDPPTILTQWIGPVPTDQIAPAFLTGPVQLAAVVGPRGPTISDDNAGDGIEVLSGLINLNIDALPQG